MIFFLKNKFFSNVALNFSFLTLSAQLIFTPLTILVLIYNFNEIQQGYYYLFLSLIGMQSFFELGLFTYVLNKAGNFNQSFDDFSISALEKRLDIVSDLSGLTKMTTRIYSYISFLFFIFIGIGGSIYLLSLQSYQLSSEIGPWITLCALTSINLYYMGLTSFLDGCGQIKTNEKYKFIFYLISAFFLIFFIFMGFGLWSLPLSFLPRVVKDILLVNLKYGKQLKYLLKFHGFNNFSFFKDVWPMQIRLALSGLFSFFQYSAMVPLTFSVLGAEAAGRVGVSLQITAFVQQALTRWLHVEQPNMAAMVGRESYIELANKFYTLQIGTLKIAVLLFTGAVIFFSGVALLNVSVLDRLLGIESLLLLFLCGVLYAVLSIIVGYLRSFSEEKAHFMSMSFAIINIVLCYIFLNLFGLNAVAYSYFISLIFVALPWGFLLKWQKDKSLNL